MTRTDWLEAGAFVCIVALLVGIGAAFLIDGMGWAAVVGTAPSWAYLGAVRFGVDHWPRIDRRAKQ